MQPRYHIPYLVLLAGLSLLCSCKSPSKPSLSGPQVLGAVHAAHDGYVKGDAGVCQAAVVLKNPTEAPIEYIIGCWPRATGELPEGTRSIAAVGLSVEELPAELRWKAGEPQMPISMMKRYGMVQTKVLASTQSERILLPLYVTPSHPGKTHNQLLIGIRQSSNENDPETYDIYIADLVL